MTRADLYYFPTYEPSRCEWPGCAEDPGYTRYCPLHLQAWAAFEAAKTKEITHVRMLQRRYRRAWERVLILASLVLFVTFCIGLWP